MKKNLLIYENLHIPFWLMKDTCWALQFKSLGVTMMVPTLTLAFLIVFKTRRTTSLLLPNLAILFWIMANSFWMCDEFFNLGLKWVCFPPFILGLLIIFYWLIFYFPKIFREN